MKPGPPRQVGPSQGGRSPPGPRAYPQDTWSEDRGTERATSAHPSDRGAFEAKLLGQGRGRGPPERSLRGNLTVSGLRSPPCTQTRPGSRDAAHPGTSFQKPDPPRAEGASWDTAGSGGICSPLCRPEPTRFPRPVPGAQGRRHGSGFRPLCPGGALLRELREVSSHARRPACGHRSALHGPHVLSVRRGPEDECPALACHCPGVLSLSDPLGAHSQGPHKTASLLGHQQCQHQPGANEDVGASPAGPCPSHSTRRVCSADTTPGLGPAAVHTSEVAGHTSGTSEGAIVGCLPVADVARPACGDRAPAAVAVPSTL